MVILSRLLSARSRALADSSRLSQVRPYVVCRAKRAVQPLRELAPLALDLSHSTTWVDLQSGFDAFFPVGLRYYWKSMFLDELADEGIETMVDWAARRPSPMDAVTFWHLGGAESRVAEDATAYSRRDAPYLGGFPSGTYGCRRHGNDGQFLTAALKSFVEPCCRYRASGNWLY